MTHTVEALDSRIEGAINFRDIGGYRIQGGGTVRRGVVYRSAMTHHITPAGMAGLRERVGLKAVLDLRGPMELEEDGVAPFADHGIAYHNVAVMSETVMTPERREERMRELAKGNVDWGEMYGGMIASGGDAFRTLFELVADEEQVPLVFHCAGGRDRTGVAAALLLSTAGVSDDDVARDYALTGALLAPHIPKFRRHMEMAGMSEEQWAKLVDTSEEAMHSFLEHLRTEHGSAAEYIRSTGATEETVERVKAVLRGI